MSARSRILTWWRAVTRSAQLEAQVEEELRSHIESYAEYLMRSGLSRHEATRRARAELRSIAARKENCRAAWGTRIFDELGGDLRFAMRMLAKSPGPGRHCHRIARPRHWCQHCHLHRGAAHAARPPASAASGTATPLVVVATNGWSG